MNGTMTRLFLDTEFTGLVQTAQLISIGLISESGHSFYAENQLIKPKELSAWHQEMVVPYLRFTEDYCSKPRIDFEHHAMKASPEIITAALVEWMSQWWSSEGSNPEVPSIEIWSDTLAYDWVLFCQLWGGALQIPSFIYYIPFDLSTAFKVKGIDPDISREQYSGLRVTHNALDDAKSQRACYMKLFTVTGDA